MLSKCKERFIDIVLMDRRVGRERKIERQKDDWGGTIGAAGQELVSSCCCDATSFDPATPRYASIIRGMTHSMSGPMIPIGELELRN